MNINGQQYSLKDLLRYGIPKTVYGARRMELTEGRHKGQQLIEVKTAKGLSATLLESKCLDIYELSYKGVNLAFFSKNGLVNSEGLGDFTSYWQGGFLSTCGLRNTGGSCEYEGEYFPTHGSLGLTAAEHISVSADENEICISGKTSETALFGHHLEMVRKITIPSDGAKIVVSDTIHNLTSKAEPLFLLYHINFGFPFLSENLELEFPEAEVRGRTDLAEQKIADYKKICPPIDDEPEVVYFHTVNEKDAQVKLTNKPLGIKAVLSYDSNSLPVLAQWKSMKSGDYALGIEPGTSFIRGRKEEMENGYDIKVPAFGKLEFGFTIEFGEVE